MTPKKHPLRSIWFSAPSASVSPPSSPPLFSLSPAVNPLPEVLHAFRILDDTLQSHHALNCGLLKSSAQNRYLNGKLPLRFAHLSFSFFIIIIIIIIIIISSRRVCWYWLPTSKVMANNRPDHSSCLRLRPASQAFSPFQNRALPLLSVA